MPNRGYDELSASDGTGEAVIAEIQTDRAISATTLDTDSEDNWPQKMILATGDKVLASNGSYYIDPSSMTIMYGHLDSGDVVIDGFAPGYSDAGNTAGQIAIIKPSTYQVDEMVALAQVGHENDGKHRGGILGNEEYFTSSGTWTKPDNLKFVIVEMVGGGGGAGGCATSGSGEASEGSGGGGGEYARKKILAGDLSATETVTVGNGGTTTAAGSASSFGSHFGAAGGGAGQYGGATSSGYYNTGGEGGTGGSGTADLRMQGSRGGPAVVGPSGTTFGYGRNNRGGASQLGGSTYSDGAISTGAGKAGLTYGGGGGGGRTANSAGAVGGTGGKGVVIVHEFFE